MPTCAAVTDPESLDTLKPDFILDLPGTENIASRLIARSAREFFRRSTRWRTYESGISVDTDTLLYQIPQPTDATVVKVCGAYLPEHNSSVLDDENRIPERRELFRQHGTTGPRGQYWYSPDIAKVVFNKRFSQPGTVRMWLALAPKGSVMDAEMISLYRDFILAGARYYAQMVPGKDYSDPNTAMMYRDIWEQGIAEADQFHKRTAKSGRPYYGRVQAMRDTSKC